MTVCELITECQRDATDRLFVKTLHNGEEIRYNFDALCRLVNVADGHWPLAYENDLDNRVIEEHGGLGALHYEFDTVGQVKRFRLHNGSKFDHHHRPAGD